MLFSDRFGPFSPLARWMEVVPVTCRFAYSDTMGTALVFSL
jgi:hypothetical protein